MPVATRSQKKHAVEERSTVESSTVESSTVESSTVESSTVESLTVKECSEYNDAWFIEESNKLLEHINNLSDIIEHNETTILYSRSGSYNLISLKVIKELQYLIYVRLIDYYNFTNKNLTRFIQNTKQKHTKFYNTLQSKNSEFINDLYENEIGKRNSFNVLIGKQTPEEINIIYNLVKVILECEEILNREQVTINVPRTSFANALNELARLVGNAPGRHTV
jgi:hypothetical protein